MIGSNAVPLPPRSEIQWDAYGVPHIFAEDERSAHYLFGWAQARLFGETILKQVALARGSLASVATDRETDEARAADHWCALFRSPKVGSVSLSRLTHNERELVAAFATGITARARQDSLLLPDRLTRLLPVTAADILAHIHRVMVGEFLCHRDDLLPIGRRRMHSGSNAWALSGKRLRTGAAALMANPHLPWETPFTWVEAHICFAGRASYGASLLGMPFLSVGFRENHGFTLTTNPAGGGRLLRLPRRDGALIQNGTTLPIQRACHAGQEIATCTAGPIVRSGEDWDDVALYPAVDPAATFRQFRALLWSDGLGAFRAALRALAIPMMNILYADRNGHTLLAYGGRALPVGARTKQPIPFDAMPQVCDPDSGFLQNCNDPPWMAAGELTLDPDAYVHVPTPAVPSLRALRSLELLGEPGLLGRNEIVAHKHDTRVTLADHVLDHLLASAREARRPTLAEPIRVLEGWDRHCAVDSRGAAVFVRWAHAMEQGPANWENGGLVAGPWTTASAAQRPWRLVNPQLAVLVLEAVAAEFARQNLALDASWGDVHRWRGYGQDMPIAGGTGDFGVLRTIEFGAEHDSPVRVARGGDGFAAIAFFDREIGVDIVASHAPGHGTLGGTVDASLQGHLIAQNTMRPVRFSAPLNKLETAEIEAPIVQGGY